MSSVHLSMNSYSTLLPHAHVLHLFIEGRASVALHTEMYFAQNPTEEDAFVLAVDKIKLSVIVPRFGIEGTVRSNGNITYVLASARCEL